jgi:hypothetical protein
LTVATAAPQIAGLPPGLQLGAGHTIRFTALDPTDGSTVSGVAISGAAIQLNNLAGTTPGSLVAGPFLLVPGTGS